MKSEELCLTHGGGEAKVTHFSSFGNISISINLCLIEIGYWDDSIYVKAQTYSNSN